MKLRGLLLQLQIEEDRRAQIRDARTRVVLLTAAWNGARRELAELERKRGPSGPNAAAVEQARANAKALRLAMVAARRQLIRSI